jgi:hypothetical protein
MKNFKFFQKETPKGPYATMLEQIWEERRRLRGYGRGEIVGGIDPARPNDSFTVIHVGTGVHELLNEIIDNE